MYEYTDRRNLKTEYGEHFMPIVNQMRMFLAIENGINDAGMNELEEAVQKYIQANYRTASLRSVAEQFHYEPSYLGRMLKSHMGNSYTDLVRELRLGEAERLLRETGLSVEKIAERSGFHNQVHFFREFRRVYGAAPGEYRKQRTSEQERP